MSAPPEPDPPEPARGREPVDTTKGKGSRALIAGAVLAIMGIVLIIVGLEGAGVFIAAVAILPIVYGAYLVFVAAPSGPGPGP